MENLQITEHQLKYLLNLVKKDMDYATKKKFPVSEEVENLYSSLIEKC